MNQFKVLRFMELFWLCIAGGMALISAWILSKGDWDQGKIPLFGTFAAVILYALRRYQRRKIQYGNNQPGPDKNIKNK